MRNRIITALVIVGVLIPVIYISPLLFKIVALIIVALATHELLEVKKERNYSIITKLLVYAMNIVPMLIITNFTSVNAIYLGIIMLVFYSLMIFDKNVDFHDMSYLLTISLFIILASNSALYLREQDNGFYIVLFTILVTAASDTGAFFTGNAIGKRKLIERISPKKTVEGLVGGVVLAVVVGVIYGYFLPTGFSSLAIVTLVACVLGFGAALGDLFFSSIKRTNKIKDFSNMLPGHGGILDRIDSHLTNLTICFILMVVLKG